MNEIFGGILVCLFMIFLSGIKIVREHDRLVVFRFGKIVGHKGPGLQMIVPLIERSLCVDTRITALSTAPVEARTLDRVAVRLCVLCRFHISDPAKAVAKVDDPLAHTMEAMHTVLRSTISERTALELLANEAELNYTLKRAISRQAKSWGVRVKSVEIKEMAVCQRTKESTVNSA